MLSRAWHQLQGRDVELAQERSARGGDWHTCMISDIDLNMYTTSTISIIIIIDCSE